MVGHRNFLASTLNPAGTAVHVGISFDTSQNPTLINGIAIRKTGANKMEIDRSCHERITIPPSVRLAINPAVRAESNDGVISCNENPACPNTLISPWFVNRV
jgi:hypothetical protein